MIWQAWWLWVAAGIGLAILEILAPGYVFLGFAVGAVLTGLMLLAGGPLAAWASSSAPLLLLVFAVVSLLAWVVMRRLFRVRGGKAKIWDRDINDN